MDLGFVLENWGPGFIWNLIFVIWNLFEIWDWGFLCAMYDMRFIEIHPLKSPCLILQTRKPPKPSSPS